MPVFSLAKTLGCPTGVEPVSSRPQREALPLSYGHHDVCFPTLPPRSGYFQLLSRSCYTLRVISYRLIGRRFFNKRMSSFITTLGILASQHHFLPYLIIYVATIFLGNISVFVSLWLAFKGYFASWGVPFLFLAISAAEVTGDLTWYALGHTLRDTRLGAFIRNRLPHHEKIEAHLQRNGSRWIFLSKFIYASSFAILFSVGWSKYDFKTFFRASLTSVVVSLAVFGGIAYGLFMSLSFLEAIAAFKRFERLLLVGLALFVVVNYILARFLKKILGKNGC